MKRALMTGLILLSIFVFSVQVRAEEIKKETGTEWRHTHTYTDMYEADTTNEVSHRSNDFDAKVGYEKALVKFTKHVNLVMEIGVKPINFDINDEDVYIELKITDAKPLFDLSKK